VTLRHLVGLLIGIPDLEEPPRRPQWFPTGTLSRVPKRAPEEFYIDLFGPPPDDGREPGDFVKRDR
jgi:hypothetical protein